MGWAFASRAFAKAWAFGVATAFRDTTCLAARCHARAPVKPSETTGGCLSTGGGGDAPPAQCVAHAQNRPFVDPFGSDCLSWGAPRRRRC